MKQVIAIIRGEKWQATRDALHAVGVEEMFHHRVLGRGRQRGLRYLRRASESGDGEMLFLPKRMVVCLVADEKAAALVTAMININQTGNYGDGKVFVRSLDRVEQVDTGIGEQAVTVR